MRLAVLLILGLAACVSDPLTMAPGRDPFPTGPANTCDGERYAALVGQDATALERVLIMRQIRVIRPGMAVTQDFRPERINFEIDAAGRIAVISCG